MPMRSTKRITRTDAPHATTNGDLARTIVSLQADLEVFRSRLADLAQQVNGDKSSASARSAARFSASDLVLSRGTLTPREREVLLHFLEHPNDKQVARRLGTKVQTVRNQLAAIQIKLGVSSRAELAVALLSPRSAELSR